jgi:hypothetical protein
LEGGGFSCVVQYDVQHADGGREDVVLEELESVDSNRVSALFPYFFQAWPALLIVSQDAQSPCDWPLSQEQLPDSQQRRRALGSHGIKVRHPGDVRVVSRVGYPLVGGLEELDEGCSGTPGQLPEAATLVGAPQETTVFYLAVRVGVPGHLRDRLAELACDRLQHLVANEADSEGPEVVEAGVLARAFFEIGT